MRRVLCLFLLVAIAAGCGHREKYARVYRGHDKRYYAKTHADGGYIYWVYSDGGGSCCSGGTWTKAATAPAPQTLVATGRAVKVEEDELADEAEQETAEVAADESTADSDGGGDGGGSDGGADGGSDGGGGGE